jgi:hypothetical protein
MVSWNFIPYSFVEGEEVLEDTIATIFRIKWAHFVYPEGQDKFSCNSGNRVPNYMSYPK